MTLIEKARILRGLIEKAAVSLTDEDALNGIELFPAWKAGISYAVGDRVSYDRLLYKVIQAHTSQTDWTPAAAASLFVRVDDPAEEWPEWRQPTGGHDAYSKGAKVSHNGKRWISDVDANVWEPGAYGWSEA